MNVTNTATLRPLNSEQIEVRYEPDLRAVWVEMRHPDRPCMSVQLLDAVGKAQQSIVATARRGIEQDREYGNRLQYQVLASQRAGVFSLGGDLAHFLRLIRARDREALHHYAKTCVDIVHASATGYGLPITTIALVQGEALGGGFEAALANRLLVAERSATFGFPETLFGMFPGMGAFSFLARRVTPAMARRIIASAKVYTAEEMYELGVVDVLAADGEGTRAVYDLIAHRKNRAGGFQNIDTVMERFDPLTYEELAGVVELYVDAAMDLGEKNLRLMEYLVRAQERRWCPPQASDSQRMAM